MRNCKVDEKLWGGQRTFEMQEILAHKVPCPKCPGCGLPVAPGEAARVYTSNYARLKDQQKHFSTKNHLGVLFFMVPLERVISDALHVMLRIVPVIYRVTIAQFCDKPEAESLSQYVFDSHGIMLAKDLYVQSASGKESNLGTECWPGATCKKLLDVYDDIVKEIHQPGTPNHGKAMAVWETFLLFYIRLAEGCDDDDNPERRAAYSTELRHLAEDFQQAFFELAITKKATVYMHVIAVDLPLQAARWGSLMRWCSQSAERIHQWTHFFTGQRSNRGGGTHGDKTCGTTIKRVTLKEKAIEEMPALRTNPAKPHRNHASYKQQAVHRAAKAKVQGKLGVAQAGDNEGQGQEM